MHSVVLVIIILFVLASTASLFTAVLWFLTYIPSFLITLDVGTPKFIQIFFCLSVNTAMAQGFSILLSFESAGGCISFTLLYFVLGPYPTESPWRCCQHYRLDYLWQPKAAVPYRVAKPRISSAKSQ